MTSDASSPWYRGYRPKWRRPETTTKSRKQLSARKWTMARPGLQHAPVMPCYKNCNRTLLIFPLNCYCSSLKQPSWFTSKQARSVAEVVLQYRSHHGGRGRIRIWQAHTCALLLYILMFFRLSSDGVAYKLLLLQRNCQECIDHCKIHQFSEGY